jgi:hypothetical protein
MIAVLLTLVVVSAVVGVRDIWDALFGLVVCIESYGPCPRT